MKLITCASYYGSGSSALTDLLSEYTTVHPNDSYEFRFIHDPDGIRDLEYHLVENHNRECSGAALKRYVKFINFNSGTWFNKKYEKYFHGQFKPISMKYVEELTDLKFKGYWPYDLYNRSRVGYYWLAFWNKIIRKTKAKHGSALPRDYIYCSNPGEEKFVRCTQEYTSALMEIMNSDHKPYLVVDQMLPSSNTAECFKYFKDDIKVFIVDRDPRDVYILARTSWKFIRMYPRNNVEDWCKWFRYTRESGGGKQTDKNIMYLRFEDLIYRYEETTKKIEDFLGLDPKDHDKKFARLNPKKSVVNTQIFKRNKKFAKDIEVIEKMLPEYLYDYDSVKESDVVGIETKDKRTF